MLKLNRNQLLMVLIGECLIEVDELNLNDEINILTRWLKKTIPNLRRKTIINLRKKMIINLRRKTIINLRKRNLIPNLRRKTNKSVESVESNGKSEDVSLNQLFRWDIDSDAMVFDKNEIENILETRK